jgi:hypothetical protein
MFSVELSCPGTPDNVAIIKRDLDINTRGLNMLSNTGTCVLYVGALDVDMTLVSDIEILPGDSVDHFQPPQNANMIYAVCGRDCAGTAILEYDDPDLVA